jgi:lipoprotein NlpD
MHSSYSRYQCRFYHLFVILITFLSLQACTSPPYYDKNSSEYRAANRPASYKVARGDTLFSIAWRYGLKYQDLAKYNNISTSYKIYPGQVIRLDIPSKVVVNGTQHRAGTAAVNGQTQASANSTYSKNNRSKYQTVNPAESKKTLHQAGAPSWQWPSRGAILKHFAGAATLNKGIDIGGKLGEPVLAAASGQVVYAGSGLRGYGKLLIIRHNDTFLSAYAHNNRLLVKEGDFVKAGQKIADMGSSGTDGVKLHFEIRRDGTPEDPLRYLPRR